jgi:DNA-binding NarL/FixJ family response regulator
MPIHSVSYTQRSSYPRLPTRRIRVLLVDDHSLLRKALRAHLGQYADIKVVGEAADGEEAVRLADTLSPDVVVMDIRMPRMNGIEATRLILQAHPSVSVIGLSFDVGTPKEEALLKAGACTVLDKGASSKQLHHAISQTVDRHRGACLPRGR